MKGGLRIHVFILHYFRFCSSVCTSLYIENIYAEHEYRPMLLNLNGNAACNIHHEFEAFSQNGQN
jgi:hypothetical protein